MMFVEGIGYIDASAAPVAEPVNKTEAVKTSFDEVLKTESEKLSKSKEKTYNLKEIFAEAAEKYDLPQELLEAIGYHESRFQAGVTSSAGAMGIMQLMPQTAKAMGVKDAYNPYDNIMGGAKLLKNLSDLYKGDLKLTLAAYAAGTGNVAKYGGIPPFKETQDFVRDIYGMLENGKEYLDNSYNVTVSRKDDNAVKSVVTDNGTKAVGGQSVTNEALPFTSDSIFTRSDYDILLEYYSMMLDIISGIGDDNSDDSDNSLADLYRLGIKQRLGVDSAESLKSRSNTASMSSVAAKYMATSRLL